MLTLRQVQAGYGHSQVLFDISLTIAPGEVVTLLGRNGMGKTTTVRAVMGQLPLRGGDISFAGQSLGGL